MAVSFVEIYNRAISSLDDPSITSEYEINPIDFFKTMYTFLLNAIPSFNNPLKMIKILSNKTNPNGQTEIFEGNGTVVVFPLSSTPLDNSFFKYEINNVGVEGLYDSITNSVTFPFPIPSGQNGLVDWYFAGQFNDGFLGGLPDYLLDTIEKILGQLLVLKWSEKEKNFLLDIRRLLNDTDFKLHDSSSATNSKVNWYSNIREECEKTMNQFSWDLKFLK
jgi:hypothetical protein